MKRAGSSPPSMVDATRSSGYTHSPCVARTPSLSPPCPLLPNPPPSPHCSQPFTLPSPAGYVSLPGKSCLPHTSLPTACSSPQATSTATCPSSTSPRAWLCVSTSWRWAPRVSYVMPCFCRVFDAIWHFQGMVVRFHVMALGTEGEPAKQLFHPAAEPYALRCLSAATWGLSSAVPRPLNPPPYILPSLRPCSGPAHPSVRPSALSSCSPFPPPDPHFPPCSGPAHPQLCGPVDQDGRGAPRRSRVSGAAGLQPCRPCQASCPFVACRM